jgi:DNA-3-methyladenine glycosylase
MKILKKEFFNRDTVEVARDLLGKKIVRIYGDKKISGIISEVEAYHGFDDKASHAFRGRTKRTNVMFGEAGVIYVYLIYGMYYCLNIVTGPKDFPSAILIRGIVSDKKEINGPGRVTQFLNIDKNLNEKPLSKKTGLWIAEGIEISPKKIKATPRIGVAYAGKIWSKKAWRFRI